MRSLKDLDAELARHSLLFGRKAEKANVSRRLMAGAVLLHGSGGMGKTTLMLHVLRDLGSSGDGRDSSQVQDAGHSLYFEDLGSFVRFLGVRKRPLALLRGAFAFRWDQDGERKERSIGIRDNIVPGHDGKGVTLTASSSMLQAQRMVVRTSLEVAVGPRFDADELAKRVEPALGDLSERIAQAVERARRGSEAELGENAGRKNGKAVPPRLAAALARVIDGAASEGDREHGIVLNFLEGELSALVEACNREVYLSAASYLRPDDAPARRLSLREFEDGLQEFLENSNLDRLVPGELTFWRWYIGIDHLERGIPGWTLDLRKEVVRMIIEKLSERDGFHVIMAAEPNPALVFGSAGDRMQDGVTVIPVAMPPREEFVSEASSFIDQNVEGLGGMPRPAVRKVLERLYDHCSGRVRLYYLVRSLKNLPALEAQGVEQVEPDASFLDRQLGDALGQLGVRVEYDMSIKNLPAVQPLLELARMEERSGGGAATRNVVSWLLDAYDIKLTLSADRYLEVMEDHGILRTDGDRVGAFDPYVAWELRMLSRTSNQEDRPLLAAFRSTNGLNRFLAALDRSDLLDLSAHVTATLSNWSATSRTDPAIYASLLEALLGGGEFPERRVKLAILAASAVLGGVPFSPGGQRQKVAELVRDAAGEGDHRLSFLASAALCRMAGPAGRRECVFCGSSMGDGQSVCASCRTDYRAVCPSCGERISPHFVFCAGCGTAVAR